MKEGAKAEAKRNSQRLLAVVLAVAIAVPLGIAMTAQAPHKDPPITSCTDRVRHTREYRDPVVGEKVEQTWAQYQACVEYDPNDDKCTPFLTFEGSGGLWPSSYKFSWEGRWDAPSVSNDLNGLKWSGTDTVHVTDDEDPRTIRRFLPEEWQKRLDPPVTATVSFSFIRNDNREIRQAMDDWARLDRDVSTDCPTDEEWNGGGGDHNSPDVVCLPENIQISPSPCPTIRAKVR